MQRRQAGFYGLSSISLSAIQNLENKSMRMRLSSFFRFSFRPLCGSMATGTKCYKPDVFGLICVTVADLEIEPLPCHKKRRPTPRQKPMLNIHCLSTRRTEPLLSERGKTPRCSFCRALLIVCVCRLHGYDIMIIGCSHTCILI